MKRWAWNIFCLFSLLAFVSSVTLWVRSYFVRELVGFDRCEEGLLAKAFSDDTDNYAIWSERGQVKLEINRQYFMHQDMEPWEWYHQTWDLGTATATSGLPSSHLDLRFAGIELRHRVDQFRSGRHTYMALTLPLWLFLPAAIPPILRWRTRRKEHLPGFPVTLASASSEERRTTEATEHTENTERKI